MISFNLKVWHTSFIFQNVYPMLNMFSSLKLSPACLKSILISKFIPWFALVVKWKHAWKKKPQKNTESYEGSNIWCGVSLRKSDDKFGSGTGSLSSFTRGQGRDNRRGYSHTLTWSPEISLLRSPSEPWYLTVLVSITRRSILSSDCMTLIALWPRKMKIDCSRQLCAGHRRTNILWLLKLLSEPKRKKNILR